MGAIELRVPPLAIAASLAAAMAAAAWLLPGWSFAVPGGRQAAMAVAALFVAAGAALVLAGVAAFHRHRTTVNPLRPSAASAVVEDGVYRLTRNPMYLGMLLALAGWAVALQSAAAIALLPLFVLAINRLQIGPEERALRARFGEPYEHYTKRVRRWL